MHGVTTTTGIEVQPNDFFGLELLARVAESSREDDEYSDPAALVENEVNKIQAGLVGKESQKKLEFALTKFRECLEEWRLAQSKSLLLKKKENRNEESLSLEWNEAAGYFQIGQKEMTDRIYRINIWIRLDQNFSTNDSANEEGLQVDLSSDECKIWSSRSVKLSRSGSTNLRVSLRCSSLNFCNFINCSYLKVKRINGDSEEKRVGFVGLPDRIASSADLEFLGRTGTEISKELADESLKLNVLMYLESCSLLQEPVAYLDQMIQRKLELSMWDQRMLPQCWTLKKKQKWNHPIELSPVRSESTDLVPLDLTSPRRLETAQHNATTLSTEAQEVTLINGSDSDLTSQADQCNFPSVLLSPWSDMTVDSDQCSQASTVDTVSVSDGDKETEMETDQSSHGWSEDSNPMTHDKEVQQDEHSCRKNDWRMYERLSLFRNRPSRTSLVAISSLKKDTRPKRHRKCSKLQEEIEALAKNIKEIEEKEEIRKTSERSPLNENIQGNILRSLMQRTPSA